MLKALQRPELVAGYGQFIFHNGNTPGTIAHYPTQFMGLPEPPRIADRVEWVSVEKEVDGFTVCREDVDGPLFVDFVLSKLGGKRP